MENKTFKKQSDFSKNDIKERLKGFTLVKEFDEYKLGASIRYFKINSDNSKDFRMGGLITYIDQDKRFIMLKNPSSNLKFQKPFSVQLNGTNELYIKYLPQERQKINQQIESIGGSENLEYLVNLVKDIGGIETLKKIFNFKHIEDINFDKLIQQGGLENVFEIISMKSLNTIKKDLKKNNK
tara:strand:- start:949 stop:1494 length:546 start_codon:yes stop_codon:yes gene_type:complete